MQSESRRSSYAFPLTLAGAGISCIAVILAITLQQANISGGNSGGVGGVGGVDTSSNLFGSSNDLKKFSSYSEMSSFLSRVQAFFATLQNSDANGGASRLAPAYGPSGGIYGGGGLASTIERLVPSSGSGANLMAKQSSQLQSDAAIEEGGANYYSGTNVQVAGVDEADFLKNDGKYVYILSGYTLTIVDAYPPESAKVQSRILLDVPQGQNLQNMFLNGDRLVIFYQGYSSIERGISDNSMYGSNIYPYPPERIGEPRTHVLVIDVSDRTSPTIAKNYDITGQYSSSRMIGDQIFILTISAVDSAHPAEPSVYDSSSESLKLIVNPDVYYFDYPQQSYTFNTVTVLNLDEIKATGNGGDNIGASPTAGLVSKTFMIGAGSTIYVSDKNIYIAYSENPWPLPVVRQSEGGAAVEYRDFIASTTIQKTVIHKISIESGSLFDYAGKAEVPGTLLNQFSMDEHGDRFTVATTSESQSYNGFSMQNNVYRFDGKMGIVGKLQGIAEGESIYAARFMGERLYLVTFRQTDPFFVIDLSNDQPQVLGKLKLPGYSNYLHPYDDTHIIGIGREGPESGNQGVKMALFDVSDLSNPKATDTYIIGSSQADSEVLRDHRALLFNKEKDVLSIPISSYDGYYYYQGDSDRSADPLSRVPGPWSGFYVFGLTPQDGFKLKGTIQHNERGDEGGIDMSQGSRSFFIKDTLYTVTSGLLKMSDLKDVEKEINHIQLSGTGEIVRPLS